MGAFSGQIAVFVTAPQRAIRAGPGKDSAVLTPGDGADSRAVWTRPKIRGQRVILQGSCPFRRYRRTEINKPL
jgi:hypothetical protein